MPFPRATGTIRPSPYLRRQRGTEDRNEGIRRPRDRAGRGLPPGKPYPVEILLGIDPRKALFPGGGYDDIDGVIHRHDAQEVIPFVHHRNREEIVLGYEARYFLLSGRRIHLDHIADHEGGRLGIGGSHDEIPEGKDPQEMLFFIHHVEIIDGFGLGLFEADLLDGFLCRGRRWNGHIFRGHDAPGGGLGIGEQLTDIMGIFLLHEVEELLRLLLREVGQQVRCIIGGHLL